MKILLIDYSQISISAITQELDKNEIVSSTENFGILQHFILNSLRETRSRFAGMEEVVIVCDSSDGYWRREVFPYYKASRKKAKESSGLDWDFIYAVANKTLEDLRENFPYKVLRVAGAEADDVIAVLTKTSRQKTENFFGAADPLVIVSSDGDFVQLHKYDNVKQWCKKKKEFVKPKMSPEKDLIIKLVKGDSGDGIPSYKSEDNRLVEGIRQKPIYQAELDKFLALSKDRLEENCNSEEEVKNISRNKLLVDFDNIPEYIENRILVEYEKCQPTKNKNKIMSYFVKNKMKNMLECIGDF